jgi:hypothetical protein
MSWGGDRKGVLVMVEFILANMLFHVTATLALILMAAVSAVTDRLQYRPAAAPIVGSRSTPVMHLPVQTPQPNPVGTENEELEIQSRAA